MQWVPSSLGCWQLFVLIGSRNKQSNNRSFAFSNSSLCSSQVCLLLSVLCAHHKASHRKLGSIRLLFKAGWKSQISRHRSAIGTPVLWGYRVSKNGRGSRVSRQEFEHFELLSLYFYTWAYITLKALRHWKLNLQGTHWNSCCWHLCFIWPAFSSAYRLAACNSETLFRK